MLILSTYAPLKALSPIFVSFEPSWNVICVRAVAPLKAFLAISVTLVGIVTESTVEFPLNTEVSPSPITVTVSGIVIDESVPV